MEQRGLGGAKGGRLPGFIPGPATRMARGLAWGGLRRGDKEPCPRVTEASMGGGFSGAPDSLGRHLESDLLRKIVAPPASRASPTAPREPPPYAGLLGSCQGGACQGGVLLVEVHLDLYGSSWDLLTSPVGSAKSVGHYGNSREPCGSTEVDFLRCVRCGRIRAPRVAEPSTQQEG